MESRRKHYTALSILIVYFISISATTLFIQCDARKYAEKLKTQHPKLPENSINEGAEKLALEKHLNIGQPMEYSDTELEASEVSSPFFLPPFDSLSPENSPPYRVNPPFSPQTPSTVPSPPSHEQAQPPPPFTKSPVFQPPPPPFNGPSPPKQSPSPPSHGLSPPAYQPPMSYPPPSGTSGPPPSHKKPEFAVWCVAKPTVPDTEMQAALDYACGSGADCKTIQPNGPCYQPDTLLAHTSYAFNSYFQDTKLKGGTCDFGGTAMLVTDDPSSEGCHFIYK